MAEDLDEALSELRADLTALRPVERNPPSIEGCGSTGHSRPAVGRLSRMDAINSRKWWKRMPTRRDSLEQVRAALRAFRAIVRIMSTV